LSHHLDDRAAFVLGHHRQCPLAVAVGDGDGGLRLYRGQQLVQGDGAAFAGERTYSRKLFHIVWATGFTGSARPFGAQADVDIVRVTGGDESADDIRAEGDADLRRQVVVADAKEI